ncbi:MAG: family 10 glycosylhydrolase [Myxococcales bacterium]|nr:family 10 glycosylhydrolase [Myxococcales bacterium]
MASWSVVAWVLSGCGLLSPDKSPPPDTPLGLLSALDEEVPEPVVDLVPVQVPREFRGMWVATVFGLDFPTRQGLSTAASQAEIEALVAVSATRGINALVFQVRPESDALYASEMEPWSRYLTGRQGGDPGYDPLDFLVKAAHAQGIEVHAWFNPYRANGNRRAPYADNHIGRWGKDHLRPWGSMVWLDPGVPEVRAHTLKVIEDVVTRYDIDGVHLDDYFYPYPSGKRSFADWGTYRDYKEGGGQLSRAKWREQNVDTLVRDIATSVKRIRPECRFGISPFGIYRPGQPRGIRGMDQVAKLHADPLAWYRADWVDYLAPQLYWSTKRTAQRYDRLLTWWDTHLEAERPLLVGLDATRVGSNREWSLTEYRTQVRLSREAPNTLGQIWFRAEPMMKNKAGFADLLSEIYAAPALPPATPRLTDRDVTEPQVTATATGLTVSHADPASVRAYPLYTWTDDGPVLDRILPPTTTSVELPEGTWVVSAVVRGALESEGVRVVVESAEVADAEDSPAAEP